MRYVLLVALAILITASCAPATAQGQQPLGPLISRYRHLLDVQRTNGRDVSRAEKENSQSLEAADRQDYNAAYQHLKAAVDMLEAMDQGATPPPAAGYGAPGAPAYPANAGYAAAPGGNPAAAPPIPNLPAGVDPHMASGEAATAASAPVVDDLTDAQRTAWKKTYASINPSPFGIYGPLLQNERIGGARAAAREICDLDAKWGRIIARELKDSLFADFSQCEMNFYVGFAPETDAQVAAIVAANKSRVHVWRIGNEPGSMVFRGQPAQYCQMLRRLYIAIKKADPTAVVTFGALANELEPRPGGRLYEYLREILKLGGGRYFDVFTFHLEGPEKDYQRLGPTVRSYKELLNQYGIDPPFWITEMGTYDGQVKFINVMLPEQTEDGQASGLVKRYAYGIALGVHKLFWDTLVEYENFANERNNYFNAVGLINNPGTDGRSWKKKAFYTYRFLARNLSGRDLRKAKVVSEADGAYVTYFPGKDGGKPAYVVWYDAPDQAGATKAVPLRFEGETSVRIAETVPRGKPGENPEMKTWTVAAPDGSVAIKAGSIPYLVEPSP